MIFSGHAAPEELAAGLHLKVWMNTIRRDPAPGDPAELSGLILLGPILAAIALMGGIGLLVFAGKKA